MDTLRVDVHVTKSDAIEVSVKRPDGQVKSDRFTPNTPERFLQILNVIEQEYANVSYELHTFFVGIETPVNEMRAYAEMIAIEHQLMQFTDDGNPIVH